MKDIRTRRGEGYGSVKDIAMKDTSSWGDEEPIDGDRRSGERR